MIGLETIAQNEDKGRDGNQDCEGRTPADKGAEHAADQERRHACASAR
jgi:hypothetical protein